MQICLLRPGHGAQERPRGPRPGPGSLLLSSRAYRPPPPRALCLYCQCRPSQRVMEDGPLPDLRDIELKLGRKVPESLARSLRGEEPAPREGAADPSGVGGSCSSSSCSSFAPSVSSSSSSSPASGSPRRSHPSALERLETKLHILRQEMVSVMRQWRPRDTGLGLERAARQPGRGREEESGSALLDSAA